MVLLLRLLTILLLWTAVIAVPLNENSAKYPAVAAQAAAIYEQAADRYVTADLYRAAADRWREATAAYETLTAAYSRPARWPRTEGRSSRTCRESCARPRSVAIAQSLGYPYRAIGLPSRDVSPLGAPLSHVRHR